MRDVFLFAGQSNCSAYSPLINTRDDRIASPYVPAYARTEGNEWTGAAPASIDTGHQYRLPYAGAYPCKYIEVTAGQMDRVFDAWGSYDKHCPQPPDGHLAQVGSYGLELSFLQRYRQEFPSNSLGCVKQSLGGTSLRGDWLPNTVQLGVAQAGSSTTITLASSDFGSQSAYPGRVFRVTSGAGAGSTATCTAYNSTTKVATFSGGWSGAAPAAGSGYGIERLQSQILRVMIEQAAARLNASEPGDWRWAGFLWMQGESGAHSVATAANDSVYLSDARAFFAWVRSITDTPDLKIGVGLVGDNWLNTNPYLIAAGVPYASIDYSTTSSGQTVTDQRRADYLAGCYARRATQLTLGSDPNCFSWNNDGYPTRPPYSLTSSPTDVTAYHWGGPGNMAAGERAFAAWQANDVPPEPPTPEPIRRLKMRAGRKAFTIRTGG